MERLRGKALGAAALLTAAAVPAVLLSGCGTAVEPLPTARADDQPPADKPAAAKSPVQPAAGMASPGPAARYDEHGRLLRPESYREWMFIGAPVTPNDLNDGRAAFPEFHNVYLDPASYAAYQQTGKFRDGAVIVKELVTVGARSMDSGNGYFQGEYFGLEAMVKDTQRFESEPGGWAFFRFGEAPHYQPTGTRMKTADCNACHSGANEDYVFTDTYPVLRAARARLTKK